MKPKEKAEELVLKFLRIDNNTPEWFNTHIAKQCALIAVEFAKENPLNTDGYNKYLDELKQEINKI